MFSQKKCSKYNKNNIPGSQKPQMLANQWRQLASQHKKNKRNQKPDIKLKVFYVQEPHSNINLSKIRIPMLLLLLVVLPQVVADSNIQRLLIVGSKVHGQPVALLPPDASCRPNPRGVTKGAICTFNNTTHYIKPFRMIGTKTEQLCYQAFNHQLAEANIGLKTAEFSFFKRIEKDPVVYISSKHVDNIKFISGRDHVNRHVKLDTATWAVASTFISDLHSKNVGYTDNGIVAVDLDGHNKPLTNDFYTNLLTAAHNINTHTPWLSLDDIRQMQKIYRAMQHKPLPKHHDSFHLTETMYQDMLNAYISICDNVIATLESTMQSLERSEPAGTINQLWCEKAKAQISWWYRPNDKFYNELCVKPKRDNEISKNMQREQYGNTRNHVN